MGKVGGMVKAAHPAVQNKDFLKVFLDLLAMLETKSREWSRYISQILPKSCKMLVVCYGTLNLDICGKVLIECCSPLYSLVTVWFVCALEFL